jgi:hypothetical protein
MPIFERCRYHLRLIGPGVDPHPLKERLHFHRFERGSPRGPKGWAAFAFLGHDAPFRRLVATTAFLALAFGALAFLAVDRLAPSVGPMSPEPSGLPMIHDDLAGIMRVGPALPEGSAATLRDRLPIASPTSDANAPPIVDGLDRRIVYARPPVPPRRCDAAPIPFGDGVEACEDLAPLDGRPVASVEPTAGAPVGILGTIGGRIGLPTGVAAFKADGETAGRDAYLAAMTVNAEGRIVSASPLAQRLFYEILAAALALGAGVLAVATVRSHRTSMGTYVGPGDSLVYLGFFASLVAAGVFARMLPEVPGWDYALLVAVAATGSGDLRKGLARLSLAAAFCALENLLQVPIAPPYAPLASYYGPAGLYVWDFALLAAATCLGLWLPGRMRYL